MLRKYADFEPEQTHCAGLIRSGGGEAHSNNTTPWYHSCLIHVRRAAEAKEELTAEH
jgi:hypothetical protein